MKRELKVIAAAIVAVLLLTGCDIPSEVQNLSLIHISEPTRLL